MSIDTVTQETIDNLVLIPKKIINPTSRKRTKGSHIEKNYDVISECSDQHKFKLFYRQNNILDDDFSCGIIWQMNGGDTLILRRYNGSSHAHKNHLEKTTLPETFHIHMAREEYIRAGKKSEGYAEDTNRYSTPDGALHCLILDCNISGLQTDTDEMPLFPCTQN